MKVDRKEILSSCKLAFAAVGDGKLLPASDKFIFKDEKVFTYNDVMGVCIDCNVGFEGAVDADMFIKLMDKFPDEEIDIVLEDEEELILQGKRRKAGMAVFDEEPQVPEVPRKGYSKLSEGFVGKLQKAARTCGSDMTNFLFTCVHIAPNVIEACDGARIYCAGGETGFDKDFLLPGDTANVLASYEITHVQIKGDWCYFKLRDFEGVMVLRGTDDDYMSEEKIAEILEMGGGEKVVFPTGLVNMIERAVVISGNDYDAKIEIVLKKNRMLLKAQKEKGWYQEKKKVKYKGKGIGFGIHPLFLSEMLEKTKRVVVDSVAGKMKMVTGDEHFVVVLQEGLDD